MARRERIALRYLLGGLRQEEALWEVYGGISPILTIQQGTLLEIGFGIGF